MCVPTEIIVLFFLISFLIYTMPMVLVKFSKTLKGKFLLLLLTIVITMVNKTGGLLMAMLLIFLSEFNYEVNNGILYEGFTDTDTDTATDTTSTKKNNIKENKKPSTPEPSTPDQLTVMEQIKSRPA
jgi:hypothetical protein